MSHLLPIVEELAGCATDAERAGWLLAVPDGVILRDTGDIRRLLREAGFLLGVEFVDVRFSALCSTRTPEGTLKPSISERLEAARAAMIAVRIAANISWMLSAFGLGESDPSP